MSIQTISRTENGDVAYSTSGSNCVDFFTRITRNASVSDYLDTFSRAWSEDRETAFKILLNMRDPRNGKGEKLIPVVIICYLKQFLDVHVYEDILLKFIEHGYWKDILKIHEINYMLHETKNNSYNNGLYDSSVELSLFAQQLKRDNILLQSSPSNDSNANISLCAKWAPSENSHYDRYPYRAAKKIMELMGISQRQYRKMLSSMRKHIVVLETLMSTQKYEEINFENIPSVALMKTKRAFNRNCNANDIESESRINLHARYTQYLANLHKCEAKVNVTGVQPHEIVGHYFTTSEIDQLVESQWLAIKQRTLASGTFRNVTAVVDVSGSMTGQPMEVAIALGILVAECTSGPYHGQVITFTTNPSWHMLTGTTLRDNVKCMQSAPWGGNTDLRAVFELILNKAIQAKLQPHEMIDTLFIFTDMQFDSCSGCNGNWESTFEYAKNLYNDAGYTIPKIVCWNLQTSDAKTIPVSKTELGYAMLSGFSSELLKCILNAEEFNPYSILLEVLKPYSVPESLSQLQAITLDINSIDTTVLATVLGKCQIKRGFKKSAKTSKLNCST